MMDRNSAANALGQKHEKNVDKKMKFLYSDPSVFATTRDESGDIHLSN